MLAWEDSSRRTSLKSRRRVLQAFDSPPPSLRELEGGSRGTQTTRGDSRGTQTTRGGLVWYTPVGVCNGWVCASIRRLRVVCCCAQVTCFVGRRVVGVGVEEFSSGAGSWSVVVVEGLRLVVVGAVSAGLRRGATGVVVALPLVCCRYAHDLLDLSRVKYCMKL